MTEFRVQRFVDTVLFVDRIAGISQRLGDGRGTNFPHGINDDRIVFRQTTIVAPDFAGGSGDFAKHVDRHLFDLALNREPLRQS
jgi:hypothetical protein